MYLLLFSDIFVLNMTNYRSRKFYVRKLIMSKNESIYTQKILGLYMHKNQKWIELNHTRKWPHSHQVLSQMRFLLKFLFHNVQIELKNVKMHRFTEDFSGHLFSHPNERKLPKKRFEITTKWLGFRICKSHSFLKLKLIFRILIAYQTAPYPIETN